LVRQGQVISQRPSALAIARSETAIRKNLRLAHRVAKNTVVAMTLPSGGSSDRSAMFSLMSNKAVAAGSTKSQRTDLILIFRHLKVQSMASAMVAV
jgi:hypothetical protein